ncbi:MAG: hypothetical protein OEV66_03295 [Spirochaetia bacterium]|nr:hypothetical protein [Spirochaetia bacterium]
MAKEKKIMEKEQEKMSVFTVLRKWSIIGSIAVIAYALYVIIRRS